MEAQQQQGHLWNCCWNVLWVTPNWNPSVAMEKLCPTLTSQGGLVVWAQVHGATPLPGRSRGCKGWTQWNFTHTQTQFSIPESFFRTSLSPQEQLFPSFSVPIMQFGFATASASPKKEPLLQSSSLIASQLLFS